MEVVLLGTRFADGWPNPFCTCASCGDARRRGDIRGQSSALVDGTLLIDCGPEIPRSAERLGRRLDGVSTLLFTHAHPDHVGPAALLFRHWANTRRHLRVVGPPAALTLCQPWIGPDDPVSCTPIRAGDVVELAEHSVRAHAAHHHGPELGPAVIYDIEGADRTRLLYACDTGELPEPTARALANRAFDIALIEETFGDLQSHEGNHLDLRTFGDTVAMLRSNHALTDKSQVVAVHLSHHNPPIEQLRSIMSNWQTQVVPDGTVLHAGRPATPSAHPHRTLVLGGARSGKSDHAEQLLAGAPIVTYVATGGDQPDDEEWQQRISRHRKRRPDRWTTEETMDLVGLLDQAEPGDVLLIDCLTLWLTRVIDDTDGWDSDTSATLKRIDELVESWRRTQAQVVAVSNEVGWGVVPASASGRLFRDLHGQLNAAMAKASDRVTLIVAGHPVSLSSEPDQALRAAVGTSQEYRT